MIVKAWEVVRCNADMWNVYCGEDFVGYVARTPDGGWQTENQRQSRSSAYLAAKECWGEGAAEAIHAYGDSPTTKV